VLDPYSLSIQSAQLERERIYNDETQHLDRPHPEWVPEWSYVEQQNAVYDTDIDGDGKFINKCFKIHFCN
jgi:hypothetical protein